MDDYITLEEAAHIAGYRDPSNLRTAARTSPPRLKTMRKSPRVVLTTRPWLDAYLATLRPGNYKRGLPKGQDAGGGEAGESV